MTKSTQLDHIGFLNVPDSFVFEGGSLTLSCDFIKAKRWVDRYLNDDGFVYPPISCRVSIDPITEKTAIIPKTRRPALLHQMPLSHDLILRGTKDSQKSRSSLAGFVTHCFAFIFGTRLQFWDWWFDGRIPIKSTVDIYITMAAAEDFISRAICTWRERLDVRSRRVVSNLLYLYSKAASLEWDWERFQLEYTVFDACYAIAKKIDGCPRVMHRDRFKALCKLYGLKYNGKLVRQFVILRNDLVHEALWDQGQPGTARSSDSFMASYHLRRLNHRLITAILAGRLEYSSSPWWFLGKYQFKV